MTAHPLFNRIAEGLSADGWFTVPGFVSREDAISIRDEAVSLREEGEFRRAGIGKQVEFQYDKSIRSDEIHWVDESETISPVKEYLSRIANLQDYLNQTCFLGLRDFESHFAVYPVGTRYARHADRFKNNPHRIVSSVLYLNPDWEEADGGQLMIYQEDGKEVSILPEAGKLVCFRSELEHEVLPCNRERYSMTGWFLDQPLGLTFL